MGRSITTARKARSSIVSVFLCLVRLRPLPDLDVESRRRLEGLELLLILSEVPLGLSILESIDFVVHRLAETRRIGPFKVLDHRLLDPPAGQSETASQEYFYIDNLTA